MSEVKPIPVWQADAEWSDDELVVRASDYAALRAENERLRDECVELNSRREALALRALDAEQKRDASLKAVPEGVEVVAHLYLGYFGPEELGEIDIDLVSPTAERLQQELVRSEDVTLSLMTVAQHNAIVAALRQPVADEREAAPGWAHWCVGDTVRYVSAGDFIHDHMTIGSDYLIHEAPDDHETMLVLDDDGDELAALVGEFEWQARAALSAPAAGLPVAEKSHGAWDGLDDLDALPDGTCLYAAPTTPDVSGLVELIEPAMHWAGSFRDAWPEDAEHPDGPWAVGAISDGEKYPVLTIDAYQYDADGDSEKIALATIKLWSAALAAHKAGGV